MQIFPSAVRDLWTTWQLPVLVLLSLFLQLLLIPMGYKRKYSSSNCLQWLLWFAYLSADSVATVSLGILFDGGGSCNNASSSSTESRYVIRAFWAPFLLLHLGGPDTITAYSVQDNDLWLRHLLGLLIQAGLSFYVSLRAIQPSAVNFIAIPVFVAGITKYGERTWVLRSPSTEHLQDQLVPARSSIFPTEINIAEQSPHFKDLHMLYVAHGFFERNKWVLVDLILSSDDLKESISHFEKYDFRSAFKVVELELGFMHDFFYTKAPLIHSCLGALLRLTTLSSTVVAIAAFCSTRSTHMYPQLDVYLTFFLLFGALGLEIYSILLLLCSDWGIIWLTKIDSFLASFMFKGICGLGWSAGKRRWSNSVPQYNLIACCFKDTNGGCCNFLRCFTSKIMDAASRSVSDELKKRIFEQVKEKLELEDQDHNNEQPDWVIIKQSCYNRLGLSLELDSDQNILLWHIATDLSYHFDHGTTTALNSSILEDSRLLSDFMAYLLAHRHSLFPNKTSQTRLHATIKAANDFIIGRESVDACKTDLLRHYRNFREPRQKDFKEMDSGSMLDFGCKLAIELRKVDEYGRWEIISHVWVQMLLDISRECKWYDHIDQLAHGGDLLTHVWLLMHHLGYTKKGYNVTIGL